MCSTSFNDVNRCSFVFMVFCLFQDAFSCPSSLAALKCWLFSSSKDEVWLKCAVLRPVLTFDFLDSHGFTSNFQRKMRPTSGQSPFTADESRNKYSRGGQVSIWTGISMEWKRHWHALMPKKAYRKALKWFFFCKPAVSASPWFTRNPSWKSNGKQKTSAIAVDCKQVLNTKFLQKRRMIQISISSYISPLRPKSSTKKHRRAVLFTNHQSSNHAREPLHLESGAGKAARGQFIWDTDDPCFRRGFISTKTKKTIQPMEVFFCFSKTQKLRMPVFGGRHLKTYSHLLFFCENTFVKTTAEASESRLLTEDSSPWTASALATSACKLFFFSRVDRVSTCF